MRKLKEEWEKQKEMVEKEKLWMEKFGTEELELEEDFEYFRLIATLRVSIIEKKNVLTKRKREPSVDMRVVKTIIFFAITVPQNHRS